MADWAPLTESIEAQLDRDVAIVTMNRPNKLNALTADMRRDLAAAFRHFGNGKRARGVVLTGAGRAFSAGEDLTIAVDVAAANGIDSEIGLFHDITRAVLETKVPTVAALNGLAVGGASEMTLCFDTRIGTPQAGYFMPENNIGLTISNASSLLLPRLMKAGPSLRLVLNGGRLNADEAVAAGLVDEIVEADALVETAVETVLRWSRPGCSTAAHLSLLRPDMEAIEAAFARETVVAREVWESGASRQGIDRFWAEKAAS